MRYRSRLITLAFQPLGSSWSTPTHDSCAVTLVIGGPPSAYRLQLGLAKASELADPTGLKIFRADLAERLPVQNEWLNYALTAAGTHEDAIRHFLSSLVTSTQVESSDFTSQRTTGHCNAMRSKIQAAMPSNVGSAPVSITLRSLRFSSSSKTSSA